MSKDYEVCFTDGNVTFVKDAEFRSGVLVGTSVINYKDIVVYVANCFYIVEVADATKSIKERRAGEL